MGEFRSHPTLECEPYSLILGVICGSVEQIQPLLIDSSELSCLPYLKRVEVWILANGESEDLISELARSISGSGNATVFKVIGVPGNRKIIPIGRARTILQKMIGEYLGAKENFYAWILDDDMRIPQIAHAYLSWLPSFKQQGVDVLVGCFDGGSPNPPAHGIRVQLFDLLANLRWFSKFSDDARLPDRSEENRRFRLAYPDYYYDLSRKHSAHLKEPYWVTPTHPTETIAQARQRILAGLEKMLTGEPFLRPLTTELSANPLAASAPTCNRGGNAFILNSRALRLTPNAIMLSNGEENRRSDMIWALINRYFYGFTIHSVPFPVYHHRRFGTNTAFNLRKTIAEFRGSAIYAALCGFFECRANASWIFPEEESQAIFASYSHHIGQRLALYRENLAMSHALIEQTEAEFGDAYQEIPDFIKAVRPWVISENVTLSEEACSKNSREDLQKFLFPLAGQIAAFAKES